MFENPRRGRKARNFTTNVPKILDLNRLPKGYFPKINVGWPWFSGQNLFLSCAGGRVLVLLVLYMTTVAVRPLVVSTYSGSLLEYRITQHLLHLRDNESTVSLRPS